jgi:hypothetical protein
VASGANAVHSCRLMLLCQQSNHVVGQHTQHGMNLWLEAVAP